MQVVDAAIKHGAAFLVSPCCMGKLKANVDMRASSSPNADSRASSASPYAGTLSSMRASSSPSVDMRVSSSGPLTPALGNRLSTKAGSEEEQEEEEEGQKERKRQGREEEEEGEEGRGAVLGVGGQRSKGYFGTVVTYPRSRVSGLWY